MVKKLLECFKKQIEFRIEKVIKTKGDELYVKWKGYDNLFNSPVDKEDKVKKWADIFLKGMNLIAEMLKVELVLSNYVVKADIKGAEDVDTSNLAAKSDLA